MNTNMQLCACGCKTEIPQTDPRGRPKKFAHGHNGRVAGSTERQAARRRAFAKKWYYKNKPKVKALQDLRRVEIREYNREYAEKNPEMMRHKAKVRRARLAGAQGSHTLKQWLDRVQFFGWSCRYCGRGLYPTTLTKDHQIPISKGGSEWASNLVPACRSCNSTKGAKTINAKRKIQ